MNSALGVLKKRPVLCLMFTYLHSFSKRLSFLMKLVMRRSSRKCTMALEEFCVFRTQHRRGHNFSHFGVP
ncbi:hypothetical protein SUGI_0245650 [Cryptomeria japonica]|nr:hypothetical protein SUGI_0245650 [Cryptomeria japonica]